MAPLLWENHFPNVSIQCIPSLYKIKEGVEIKNYNIEIEKKKNEINKIGKLLI